MRKLLKITSVRMPSSQTRWRSMWALRIVLAIVGVISVATVAVPVRLRSQTTIFHERVDLVKMGVTVADKRHRLIADLGAGDFAIFEDGKPQTIRAFAVGSGSGPQLHAGVMLDVSESQERDIGFTQTAAIKFLRALAEAVDITFVDFATEVRAARYPQSDFPRLVEHVRANHPEQHIERTKILRVPLDESAMDKVEELFKQAQLRGAKNRSEALEMICAEAELQWRLESEIEQVVLNEPSSLHEDNG